MKFEPYYITDKDGYSNCVIRTFCKVFNQEYDTVYHELLTIKKDLNCESFNDVAVFEKYMETKNTRAIEYGKDIKIKDLVLDNSSYIIFCWDKKDFYHMVAIIDNVLYDREDSSKNLYAITVYKKVGD